jgi:hypothetical protein
MSASCDLGFTIGYSVSKGTDAEGKPRIGLWSLSHHLEEANGRLVEIRPRRRQSRAPA